MSNAKQLFRYFSRVKIKEGHEADFLEMVPTIVEVTGREPGCYQCEAFYNEETRTVAWIESFDGIAGFAGHFGNPEIHELQPKVFPMVDIEVMRLSDAIPEELEAGLTEAGMPLEIGEPWPGTTRLHKALPGQPCVQINFEAEWNDVDAGRRIAAGMTEATADRAGVLHLQYYDLGNDRVHVHQAYTDQAAFVEWATSEPSQAAADELGGLLSNVKVEVFGDVNGQAKEFLDGWGGIYYRRLDGFSRFNS
jgi:quinol monooxygenase YgiN